MFSLEAEIQTKKKLTNIAQDSEESCLRIETLIIQITNLEMAVGLSTHVKIAHCVAAARAHSSAKQVTTISITHNN